MPAPSLQAVLRYLRRASASPVADDAALLDRFLQHRDDNAFAALVNRHGPAVLGVCHRILADDSDAEDAFQATFLVLARQAGVVVRRESVGSFLYGVAVRVALRARADRARRRRRERQVSAVAATDETPEPLWNDLRPILDEELLRLPPQYREALRLCYLDGRSYDEAARLLGCSKGTVASRLARARERLRQRLRDRGVTPAAPLLSMTLSAHATPAPVPPALQAAALRAATAACTVPPRVLELAAGAGRALLSGKVKVVLALLLATAVPALVGVAVFGEPGAAKPDKAAPADPQSAADRATWQVCARLGSEAHPVAPVRISPDSRTLVTFDGDAIRFWDTANWNVRSQYAFRKGHDEEIPYIVPSFSPDGRACAVFALITDPKNENKNPLETVVLQTATGRELARLPGAFGLFSPDGACLVTWATDNRETWELIIWDPHTLRRKFSDRLPGRGIRGLASFSADGSLLAADGADGRASFVWETATGKERYRPDGEFLEFDRAGRSLLTRLPDGTVKVWDAATGKPRAVIPGPRDLQYSAAFAPDGRQVLTIANVLPAPAPGDEPDNLAARPADVRLWDANTGAEVTRLPGRTGSARLARFAPDAKTVIYTRLESEKERRDELVLWDVAAGKERAVLRTPAGIRHARFAPDGNTLFTIGPIGGEVTPWDPSTGSRRADLLERINYHSPMLSEGLQFSPDGKLLVGSAGGRNPGPAATDLLVFRLSGQPLPPPVQRGTSAVEEVKPAAGTKAGQALADLQKEIDNDPASRDLYGRLRTAKTDAGRKPLLEQLKDREAPLVERAAAIARDNLADPAAIKALEFGLLRTQGGYGGKIGTARDALLALIREKFLAAPALNQSLLVWLARQETDAANDLLATIAEKNPVAAVRGRAAYALAEQRSRDTEASRLLRSLPELFDRQRGERPDTVERLRRIDPDACERDAARWYSLVKEKYADVTWSLLQDDQPPTEKLGPRAEKGLFTLHHLSLGTPAPEIAGTDLGGKPFRLSDFRGKVVVLFFGGRWSAQCRSLYPHLRRLVEAHAGQPFAVAEVSSDPSAESVLRAMARDGDTWRCWADAARGGPGGPIARRWDVDNWPRLFVLDGAGVIRYKELRDKLLERAVDQLLREAAPVRPK